MKTSDMGLDMIKQAEGWVPVVYADQAGLPTIGYGHLISRAELGLPPLSQKLSAAEYQAALAEWMTVARARYPKEISEASGTALLQKDVEKFERGIERLVKVPLNQNQFDALVDFVFNVGLGALESSNLLRRLNRGDYDIENEFMKWNKITDKKTKAKVPLAGLTRRRKREADLWGS